MVFRVPIGLDRLEYTRHAILLLGSLLGSMLRWMS